MSTPQTERGDRGAGTMNEDFNPQKGDAHPELVLNIMKTDPYPTITPHRVVERTRGGDPELNKVAAFKAIDALVGAGWVTKREHGLYDLVEDPRQNEPQWPVPWGQRKTLPGPLPNEPPVDDRDHIETTNIIHQNVYRWVTQRT